MIKLKFVKRKRKNLRWQLTSFFIALVTSLLVSGLLMVSVGQNAFEAFWALFEGAFIGQEAILDTLLRATPLIFTGLATVVAFRARIWSIGQEGQLVMGAIFAYGASAMFSDLPSILLIPLAVIAGFIGGALLGGLCGWLKYKFRVDEVISTVMLNYIVGYFLTYLLSGPWREKGSYYLQTEEVVGNALFPIIFDDYRLHIGFLIAILTTVFMYLLIRKTPLGYDIKALGMNPTAFRYKGANISKMFILVMMISGGVAGLAGTGELLGIHGRLNMDISLGLGFTGIIVAMIGGLTTIGTFFAAFLFGGLVNGGYVMQVMTGVPLSIVYASQAIILLFFLCSALLAKYRIIKVTKND
jgi:general nucleoside transport system permease protein